MHKDDQITRLRKVLRGVMEEASEDCGDLLLEPLTPEVEAKLLQISMRSQPQQEPWYRRAQRWLDDRLLTRYRIVALLAPVAVLALVVWRGFAQPPLDDYALLATKTVSPQTPAGRVLLGASSEAVHSTQELRIKRQDTLTLILRPPRTQKGEVAVQSFIRHGSQIEDWGVNLDPAEDGSFRLHLPIDELPKLGPEQDLLFQVGRPKSILSAAALQEGQLPDARSAHLYALHLIVEDAASTPR